MDQTLIALSRAAAAPEPDEPVARKRGRPRDPQADQRILDAAAHLILVRGFDAMTVDEVASRARVGKATVYRRWAHKEELAVAAMVRLYTTEMPVPDTGSIHDDLMLSYASLLAFANSAAGRTYLRTTIAEAVRDRRIAKLHREAAGQIEAYAAAMFESAIDRGEVRRDADTFWAMQFLTGLITTSIVTGRALPREEEAEKFVRMLLRGIAS